MFLNSMGVPKQVFFQMDSWNPLWDLWWLESLESKETPKSVQSVQNSSQQNGTSKSTLLINYRLNKVELAQARIWCQKQRHDICRTFPCPNPVPRGASFLRISSCWTKASHCPRTAICQNKEHIVNNFNNSITIQDDSRSYSVLQYIRPVIFLGSII